MTRKKRRLYIVTMGMAALGIAAALVLTALEENLVFFYSPTDVKEKNLPVDQRFRVGGLVVKGSVGKAPDGVTVLFSVTDTINALPIRFRGVLPDLFREGQGIVAEGVLTADGSFRADEVLAKHDENYMPKEVAEALKKSGQWKGEEGAASGPASGDGAAYGGTKTQ